MSDTDTATATDSTTDDAASQTSADDTAKHDAKDSATGADAEKALGDAGKQALDRMKAERKEARDAAATEKARADALQAKLDGKEAEHQAEQAKREAEQTALAKANQRILKAEVKAAAKGVLADPADAYKFLDLDSFEVNDDGDVDDAAIAAALEDLVTNKPYLGAQGGKRFQGEADNGARKEAAGVKQLTRDDLSRMSPEQIEAAREGGQLADLLNGK